MVNLLESLQLSLLVFSSEMTSPRSLLRVATCQHTLYVWEGRVCVCVRGCDSSWLTCRRVVRSQVSLAPRCFVLSPAFDSEKWGLFSGYSRGAIFSVHSHAHAAPRYSKDLHHASAHYWLKQRSTSGVMNCTSGEQSLIYGQEQESRPFCDISTNT